MAPSGPGTVDLVGPGSVELVGSGTVDLGPNARQVSHWSTQLKVGFQLVASSPKNEINSNFERSPQ